MTGRISGDPARLEAYTERTQAVVADETFQAIVELLDLPDLEVVAAAVGSAPGRR